MKVVRLRSTLSFALVLAAACADAPTAPDAVSVGTAAPSADVTLDPITVIGEPKPPPTCDPYLSLNWCQGSGGGTCIESFTGPTDPEYVGLMGCTGTGGGGTGGTDVGGGDSGGSGDTGITITPPVYEGPGVFAACVGTLLAVMGTTAAMQPAATSLYDSRNAYDSAKRMYDAVVQNSPTLEMQLLYEHRVEVAKMNYDNAIQSYAASAGASILAVLGAVVVCSPGVLLPTP